MKHTCVFLPTRNSSTRKLLPCGIEVVMSHVHCQEALLKYAQSVSLRTLTASSFLLHTWDMADSCVGHDQHMVKVIQKHLISRQECVCVAEYCSVLQSAQERSNCKTRQILCFYVSIFLDVCV